ncbi:MAG: hypothetical protein AAFU03_10565, partial [Bacteroidota bacterium]
MNTAIQLPSVNLAALFLLSGLLLVPSIVCRAQNVVQDFEAATTGNSHFVDSGSSLNQHFLVNNPAPQTAPGGDTEGAVPGYQVEFVPSRMNTANVGLNDGDLFGTINVNEANSPDNDLGSVTIDFTAQPPPSGGNNVYLMEDSDGLTIIRFNPITPTATTNFSMNYIISDASFENSDGASDRVKIYLSINAGLQEVVLLDVADETVPNNETWQTLTSDLAGFSGSSVQLVIEFDANSASEEMAIDNISFTDASVVPNWPVCTAASVPMLSQINDPVCVGLPFGIGIDANLNDATAWHVYTDADGIEEVGVTSANAIYFYSAEPGTTYYVRGEGGCVEPGMFVALPLQITDPLGCLPDETPGTSFEEPLGFSADYIDTGDPTVAHQLMNNQGQPTVDFPFTATELGFQSFFTPTRTGGSSEVGLTDGDGFGVTNIASANFPDGDQGFIIEDTDGMVRIEFSPVDMSDASDPSVSLQYFVNGTSYEASNGSTDRLRVFLDIDNGAGEFQLISGEGSGNMGLDGMLTDTWALVNTPPGTLEGVGVVQLIIEADFDAATD